MNRRSFFKGIAAIAGAIVAAPLMKAEEPATYTVGVDTPQGSRGPYQFGFTGWKEMPEHDDFVGELQYRFKDNIHVNMPGSRPMWNLKQELRANQDHALKELSKILSKTV